MASKRLSAMIFAVLCGPLSAAYIGYLYPAGARAGDEVEILVGGQGLWGVRNVILTGGGISDVVCRNVPGLPVPSAPSAATSTNGSVRSSAETVPFCLCPPAKTP